MAMKYVCDVCGGDVSKDTSLSTSLQHNGCVVNIGIIPTQGQVLTQLCLSCIKSFVKEGEPAPPPPKLSPNLSPNKVPV